ncbi:MAG: hypothetical protein ACJLS2_00270 [Microcella pacifica]
MPTLSYRASTIAPLFSVNSGVLGVADEHAGHGDALVGRERHGAEDGPDEGERGDEQRAARDDAQHDALGGGGRGG